MFLLYTLFILVKVTQQTCDTPGFLTCSTLTALSVDNTDGNNGSYFNFNAADLNNILQRNDWNAQNMNIYHKRHLKYINMSFFNTNQGGTVGDSYGKIYNDDTFQEINATNFQDNDIIVVGERCNVKECHTCTGTASSQTCTLCFGDQSQPYSRVDNTCQCPNKYFAIDIQQNCQACPYQECAQCTNNTECSVCIGVQNKDQSRIINSTSGKLECICPAGYTSDLATQDDCIPDSCPFNTCLECVSITECSVCIGSIGFNYSRGINPDTNQNECVCPKSYYSLYPTYIDCLACATKACKSCNDDTQCTVCVGVQDQDNSRILVANSGVNDCSCPIGYYSNIPSTDDCQKCLEGCIDCDVQNECSGGLTGCKGDHGQPYSRGLNSSGVNQCVCPEGYYSDIVNNVDNCQKCADHFEGCKTCTVATQCSSCLGVQGVSGSRVRNPSTNLLECVCPYNYYSVLPSDPDCVQCQFEGCQTCENTTECLTCFGPVEDVDDPTSRIVTDTTSGLKECKCRQGYYSNLPSYTQCLKCLEGCIDCENGTECTGGLTGCKGDHGQVYSRGINPDTGKNECVCPEGYYSDIVNGEPNCQKCTQEGCKTCINGDQCTSCLGVQGELNSRIPGSNGINECICPDKYFSDIVNGNDDCVSCQFEGCQTCTEITECTSCQGTADQPYSRISSGSGSISDCICPDGYYSNIPAQADCQKCFDGCIVCNNGIECSGVCRGTLGEAYSRVINPVTEKNECICPIGYYSDISLQDDCFKCSDNFEGCKTCSVSTYCDTCLGDQLEIYSRIGSGGLNTCVCPNKFYSDLPNQENCQPCKYEGCLTCVNGDECVICIGDQDQAYSRISNGDGIHECICPIGYYTDISIQDNCLKCEFQCKTCADTAPNCTECVDGRLMEHNKCKCPPGLYDDGIDLTCLVCQRGDNCLECDKDKCLKCDFNQLPNWDTSISEECHCVGPNILGHEGISDYCTDCEIMVIKKISFSEDYFSINIEFYDAIIYRTGTISINQLTNEFCVKLLEPETLDLLGQNPRCQLNAEGTNILIKLGYKPTIEEGETFQFQQNIIQRVVCEENEFINTFYQIQMTPEPTKGLPVAYYNKLGDSLSLCQDIQVNINAIKNDGSRELSDFTWSLDHTTSTTGLDKITNLLNQMNTDKQDYLLIPALTLEAGEEYVFKVTYKNFAAKTNNSQFSFRTLLDKRGIVASVVQTRPFLFKNYIKNEIEALVSLVDCSDISFTNIPLSLNITWIDETDINNPIVVINKLTKPGQQQQKYVMPKYSQQPGKVYDFKITIQLPGQSHIQNIYFLYEIQKSDLIAQIEGGNRLQSYTKELLLKARGYDPDLIPQIQEEDIYPSWNCQELGKQQPCKKITGEILVFNDTNTVYFQKKIIEPYNSFLFTYDITKVGMSDQQDSVILVIVETDLPQLTVQVPQSFSNQKININDDLQISISSDKNPDDVFFSIIFLYKLEVVATKAFDYSVIGFKIWDIYNGFATNSNQLQIRVTMYDPQFFMPATSNFNIEINFEPQDGIITVTPLVGIAMETEFLITLDQFDDQDLPLSFKYQYYLSESDYLKEVQNGTKKMKFLKNILTDYQSLNYFQTKLPQGNFVEDGEIYQILLMVSVSDSLGAVRNITQIIDVNPSENTFQEQLNMYKQDLDQIELLLIDDQISYLNLLATQLTEMGISNCQNNCTANGICVQEKLQKTCECDGEYYLQDCSQNIGKEQYVSLLQQTYSYLYSYTEQAKSQAIKDQIIKSMNRILNDKEIGNNIKPTDISSNFDKQKQILQEQQEIMETLIYSGQLYQGDNVATTKFQQATEVLSKGLENLDTSIKNINKLEERGESTTVDQSDGETDLQQQMAEMSKNTAKILQAALIPNGDPVEFTGSQLKLSTQKITNKKMQSLYFESVNTIIEANFNEVEQNTNNQDGEQEQEVYNSSQFKYKENPYKNDKGFPIRKTDVGVSDLDIVSSKLINNEEEIQINKSLNIRFPVQEAAKVQDCVTRNNKTKTWSKDHCQTQEIENDLGEPQINCSCKTLEAATVVDDFDNLFQNSLVNSVFSNDGLNSLATFKFWEFIMFYILLVKTLFFISIMVYGYKLDNKLPPKIEEEKQNSSDEEDNDIASPQETPSNLIKKKEKKNEQVFSSEESSSSSDEEKGPDVQKIISKQIQTNILYNVKKQNQNRQIKRLRTSQLNFDITPINVMTPQQGSKGSQNFTQLLQNQQSQDYLQTSQLETVKNPYNQTPETRKSINTPMNLIDSTPKNKVSAYERFRNNFNSKGGTPKIGNTLSQTQEQPNEDEISDFNESKNDNKNTPKSKNSLMAKMNQIQQIRRMSTQIQQITPIDLQQQQQNQNLFSIQSLDSKDSQEIQIAPQIQGLSNLLQENALLPISEEQDIIKKHEEEQRKIQLLKEQKINRKRLYSQKFEPNKPIDISGKKKLTEEQIQEYHRRKEEEERKKKEEEEEKQRKIEEEQRKKAEVFKKPIEPNKITPISAGVIKFHEFFSIFYIKEDRISRPVRFAFYYLKITLIIAISGLFSQNTNLIQNIILSIISALFIVLPISILMAMYKSTIFVIRIISVILLVSLQLVVLFTIVATASIMGSKASNEWVYSYSYTFMTDFCVLMPISTTVILVIIKYALVNGKDLKFIDKKAQEKMIKFLYPEY